MYTTKTVALSVLALVASKMYAQSASKQETFAAYSNLLNGTWETKGRWKSGADYHQHVIVEMELTKGVFIVKTKDFVDAKQFDGSLRNYGIRAWDKDVEKMKFWEFDVFGGITSGEVEIKGKDIYHIYEYKTGKGETKKLVDAWIYVDANTYTFKVCEYKDGGLGQEYLSSTYSRL